MSISPPSEAGLRVSMVLTASLMGMALGGWMSGMIFDLTGSYQAAFVNGVLWNLLNMAIALWLLRRSTGYSPWSPARAATSGTRSRSSTRS